MGLPIITKLLPRPLTDQLALLDTFLIQSWVTSVHSCVYIYTQIAWMRWPNVGPARVATLGQRWQSALAQCNVARRGNVGPTVVNKRQPSANQPTINQRWANASMLSGTTLHIHWPVKPHSQASIALSITEEFQVSKCRLIMTQEDSKDAKVSEANKNRSQMEC